MRNLLLVVQIVVALFLTVSILIQARGTGFGRVWGASASSFSRRGLEKLVFRATFALAAIFIIVSILQFIF